MFNFEFAEIMQMRLPLPVLNQVFGRALREKDMTGIANIHDPLGYVDSCSGNI